MGQFLLLYNEFYSFSPPTPSLILLSLPSSSLFSSSLSHPPPSPTDILLLNRHLAFFMSPCGMCSGEFNYYLFSKWMVVVIYWSKINLLVTTPLKKNNDTLFSNQMLSTKGRVLLVLPFFFHNKMLTGPILCRSCEDNHS